MGARRVEAGVLGCSWAQRRGTVEAWSLRRPLGSAELDCGGQRVPSPMSWLCVFAQKEALSECCLLDELKWFGGTVSELQGTPGVLPACGLWVWGGNA